MENKARKLGTFIWFGYRIPGKERVRFIREAGFKTVLHWWDDSFIDVEGVTKEEQAEMIRKEGLFIENAHLSYTHVNDLWLDTINGADILAGYLSDIESMGRYEIPIAVMHTTTGRNPPTVSSVGIDRFKRIAEKGQSCGVGIAVENVRFPEITEKVLTAADSLGFCYDSGHDFIWSKTPYELLKKYGSRLWAVHLHDNMGVKDDHLPPGEGRLNWDIIRTGIEKSSYKGSLTLESDTAEIPACRTAEEHLKKHYDGAVSKLYGKY